MDLTQLQAIGAIVPKTLFKKEIPINRPVLKPKSEWANPELPEETGENVDETLTTWIRKRSSADFLEMYQAPSRDKAHIAVLRCVCHADGTEVFESLEQCKQLKEWLFVPLIVAVNEVNQFGLKNSQPRTSSGAKSRSPSAAAALPNGSKRSAKKSGQPGFSTAQNGAP